jgi:hypothetical protein
MKFIEVAQGVSINVDFIVSVVDNEGTLTIETENKEYKVTGDYKLFMEFLDADDRQKREQEKLTTQFFGG